MTISLAYLSLAILFGYLGAAFSRKVHLPAVTGYLIAGLLLGFLRIIPVETARDFDILADLALGFIAFSIGSEFKWSFLKQVGMTPIIITIFEAFGAVLVLDFVLILIGTPLPVALLLGAIGAATAPAATLMVVRQYKADGPVTRMLLPVVAMDDAAALIAFSLSAAVVQILVSTSHTSLLSMIIKPFIEIGGSVLLGAVLGILAALSMRWLKHDSDRLGISLAVILAGVGLSAWLDFSSLLACMAAGAVFCNISKDSVKLMKLTDAATPPLFLIFFVISGAELDLSVLKSIGLIGIVYVFGRVLGKIGGAYLGARVSKADSVIRRYLGYMLIPQAGVAIGLSLVAMRIMPESGPTIRAVILCATLIYELFGPVITKIALKKAGEIPAASHEPESAPHD